MLRLSQYYKKGECVMAVDNKTMDAYQHIVKKEIMKKKRMRI